MKEDLLSTKLHDGHFMFRVQDGRRPKNQVTIDVLLQDASEIEV